MLGVAGEGAGECADVLTCGVCQKDFLLADILRFIQHKVHNCQAPSCGQEGPQADPHDSAAPPPSAPRDHNGDVGGSEGNSRASTPLSVTDEGDEIKVDDKRKRDDEDDTTPARKKPRSTQDAEANTTDSGEYGMFFP